MKVWKTKMGKYQENWKYGNLKNRKWENTTKIGNMENAKEDNRNKIGSIVWRGRGRSYKNPKGYTME